MGLSKELLIALALALERGSKTVDCENWRFHRNGSLLSRPSFRFYS